MSYVRISLFCVEPQTGVEPAALGWLDQHVAVTPLKHLRKTSGDFEETKGKSPTNFFVRLFLGIASPVLISVRSISSCGKAKCLRYFRIEGTCRIVTQEIFNVHKFITDEKC